MPSPIRIENERLLISALGERDLPALTAMRNDRRIYRYEPTFLAERQGSPGEALRALRRMDLERDRQCILGIREKAAPDALAGLAEFYDFKPSGKVISVGYRLRPEFWGRGVASSCVRALADFLLAETGVELVTAHVIPANIASSRCLLKNGFEYLLTKAEDWGHEALTVADVYTLDFVR